MQLYKAGDNEFLELALRLRSDILAQPCHKGLDISEDAVMACIPDSLYDYVYSTCSWWARSFGF